MSENRAKQALVHWFRKNKRVFPWREEKSAYKVFVSEMMLQQTRASVVVPYFHRFMEKFPDVHALARAKIEEVVKAWEGLGYYRRARFLHEAACYIVREHQGVFPNQECLLRKIPGIGSYTAGAILSFAFGQKAPAIDGNVLRVMARFALIEEVITSSVAKKKVEKALDSFLEGDHPHEAMEAIIELGALVCGKTPDCPRCPLKNDCLASAHEKEQKLPIMGKKLPTVHINRVVILAHHEGKFVVYQEKNKLMKDLWQFPYRDFTPREKEKAQEALLHSLGLKARWEQDLVEQKQSFTRFQVKLYPSLWEIEEVGPLEGNYSLKTKEELLSLPFCSGHRRIISSDFARCL